MEIPIEKLIEKIPQLPRKIMAGLGFGALIYYEAKDLPDVYSKTTAIVGTVIIAIWTIWTHYKLESKNPTPDMIESVPLEITKPEEKP